MMSTEVSGQTNEAAERFTRNSSILSKKLLTSESGKSGDHWKGELFKTLSQEEIQEHDNAKAKAFSPQSFRQIRKTHRPDLEKND